jgi:hypothetical protein
VSPGAAASIAACGFEYVHPLAQTVSVADAAPFVVAIRTQTDPSKIATRRFNATLRVLELWEAQRPEQDSDRPIGAD